MHVRIGLSPLNYSFACLGCNLNIDWHNFLYFMCGSSFLGIQMSMLGGGEID